MRVITVPFPHGVFCPNYQLLARRNASTREQLITKCRKQMVPRPVAKAIQPSMYLRCKQLLLSEHGANGKTRPCTGCRPRPRASPQELSVTAKMGLLV